MIRVLSTISYRRLTILAHSELKNISMELISEESGGNGTVADIIVVGYTQQNGNTILYPLHAATPAGNYQIRMNATIYAGNSPLSTIVTRSQSFNISLANSYQCLAPAFTPVRSILDPAYSPLRLATPAGGAVFSQNTLASESANITGTLYIVDGSFDTENINATLDLVNLETGISTKTEEVPQTAIDEVTALYSTSNITLAPGTWKLRMNFTDSTNTSAPRFTCLSDEFYIVLASPCVGLGSGTTSSMTSPTSSSGSLSSTSSQSSSGTILDRRTFVTSFVSLIVLALVTR